MTVGPTGATVLVTGGAGFIGSHVVDALAEHNDVRVLDDLSAGSRTHVHENAQLIVGDMCDEATVREATAGVDVVFNQAAVVSVDRSVEAPAETQAINVGGTLAVLEAARTENARVVLASSAALYGDPESVPVAESHPTEPRSPYGLEKRAVDSYARLYNDLYGLETVALRYFNVYGPRQSGGDYAGVVSAFLEQTRAGGPLTVHGDGSQTRDFVHVADVADVVRANCLAATTGATGEAFNVGTGRSVSIRELAGLFQDLAQTSVSLDHVDAREGDVRRSRADISKATQVLGYEPRRGLRDGLRELLRA